MTAAVCDQQLTVIGAIVYLSYGARLFMAQTATHAVNTPKRREQNLSVGSGISEAQQ